MSTPPSPTPLVPAITVAQFRADVREFINTATYPDSMVMYWLVVGTLMLNQSRWGNLYNLGLEMFVAHNVQLEGLAVQTAAANGAPGITRGPISSETPGQVSLSYAVEAATEKGGGYYNETIYGKRFYRLLRMVGAGPIQIGIGWCSPLGSFGGCFNGAYEGPDPFQVGGPGWSG